MKQTMLTVSRHGITSRFDTSPWPDSTPSLYRPFLKNEFYEQRFLDYIRGLRLRGVYVDAGSCLGTHTVWFGLYCRSIHVHAFDPRARCARWTQMNVDANDLGHKVTVHPIGLSDRSGEATSRLDGVDETFQVKRLDEVIDGSVALIKADVEGMEELVLRGAHSILRRDQPVIFAEAFSERERAAIEGVLEPYGYRATGNVFNSTPTYEFVAGRRVGLRVRQAVRRLPKPMRKAIVAARDGVARALTHRD